MRLISWNMNQRTGSWRLLSELMREYDVGAAMVQEAVAPPNGIEQTLKVFSDPSLGDTPWRTPVPTGTTRTFASAVAVRSDVPAEAWVPMPLGSAAYGAPAISHPGQWVAVGTGDVDDRTWIVSLYGLWDTMPDSGDIFAEATLHRAISDLTWLLQARSTRRVVIAGDLNIWLGYGHKKWEPRYRTVFDRLAAYGLEVAGPYRMTEEPLAGCPCKAGAGCKHVRTYRHMHRADSTPYQNDYVFVRGGRVTRCEALDEERCWATSDHCPIFVELDDDLLSPNLATRHRRSAASPL
jgi:Endonuclease/Exonuclease/phosphatase family